MKSLTTLTLLSFFSFFIIQKMQAQVDTEQLQKVKEFAMQTDADGILVMHKDKVIAEWYNPDCDSVYMGTDSLMKSLTGVMIGRLVYEGLIESEDDLVCKYLPEWEAGCKNKVTIRHLLTMTAGFKKRRARTGPKRFIFLEKDFNAFMLEQEPDTLPGTMWSYSNETVQLLSPLIEKVCEMDVEACFQEKLFEPLGMDSTTLYRDPSGNVAVFGGANTTMRDIAQIGRLMLNGGVHDGKRLISEDWVEKSSSSIPLNKYYGYLWWVDSQNNNFTAMGDFGQMCIVYPEEELVYVRYQICSNTPDNNMKWMGPKFIQMIKKIIPEG